MAKRAGRGETMIFDSECRTVALGGGGLGALAVPCGRAEKGRLCCSRSAVAGVATSDRSLAQEVLDQRPVMRQRERELRDSRLSRLRDGLTESLETSEIHLDVLTNLKRIDSHITSIAFPILEE